MRGTLGLLLAACFVILSLVGLKPALSMPTTVAVKDRQTNREALSVIDRYYSPNWRGYTFSRRFSYGNRRLPFDYRPYAYYRYPYYYDRRPGVGVYYFRRPGVGPGLR